MEMTDWQLNQMMPIEMKIHPSTARYDVANATSSPVTSPFGRVGVRSTWGAKKMIEFVSQCHTKPNFKKMLY